MSNTESDSDTDEEFEADFDKNTEDPFETDGEED